MDGERYGRGCRGQHTSAAGRLPGLCRGQPARMPDRYPSGPGTRGSAARSRRVDGGRRRDALGTHAHRPIRRSLSTHLWRVAVGDPARPPSNPTMIAGVLSIIRVFDGAFYELTSSGWNLAAIRRTPSCQSTVVPPMSSCVQVTSVGLPRRACSLSSKSGSLPTSEPR